MPYKDFRERLRSETPQAFEPVAATVQWAVSLGITNGRYFISGKCSRPNCGTLQFDGKPDASLASITFIHSCGCSKPEKVPTAVVEQYKNSIAPSVNTPSMKHWLCTSPLRSHQSPLTFQHAPDLETALRLLRVKTISPISSPRLT